MFPNSFWTLWKMTWNSYSKLYQREILEFLYSGKYAKSSSNSHYIAPDTACCRRHKNNFFINRIATLVFVVFSQFIGIGLNILHTPSPINFRSFKQWCCWLRPGNWTQHHKQNFYNFEDSCLMHPALSKTYVWTFRGKVKNRVFQKIY